MCTCIWIYPDWEKYDQTYLWALTDVRMRLGIVLTERSTIKHTSGRRQMCVCVWVCPDWEPPPAGRRWQSPGSAGTGWWTWPPSAGVPAPGSWTHAPNQQDLPGAASTWHTHQNTQSKLAIAKSFLFVKHFICVFRE